MTQRVYIETTIPSYLTARPTRDVVHTARIELTREWWNDRRSLFDLYTSQFVLDESAAGDPDAAQRRMEAMQGIPLLPVTDLAVRLAEALVVGHALPEEAGTDALHVATATVHEMDILLTWNCRHLANGAILGAMSRLIRGCGYEAPVICTPEELMGE